MIGIYKITNNINGNAYIGLSINIEKRWEQHKKNCLYKDEYEKSLYRAFRKYGLENFSFEVIEECAADELKNKERYWIKYYNTYERGYNMTPGGDGVQLLGERHPNHKLTENDVKYIRELWASKTISTREMYYEFSDRIGKTGFKKIYTWQTWKNILPELNTEENRRWHRENKKSYISNFGVNITLQEFENIKTRFLNGESMQSIYSDYKDRYSNYHSFYNANIKRIHLK